MIVEDEADGKPEPESESEPEPEPNPDPKPEPNPEPWLLLLCGTGFDAAAASGWAEFGLLEPEAGDPCCGCCCCEVEDGIVEELRIQIIHSRKIRNCFLKKKKMMMMTEDLLMLVQRMQCHCH